MTTASWQPTATIELLREKALLLKLIRDFFAERNVLEVDTPIASHFGVTDVYLENISCHINNEHLQLQTSPEYAMKRLLASGSGCIYQICKAFRNDEVGKLHNPEFTMLEWYRVGFDHFQLIDEVTALLQSTLNTKHVERKSYLELFQQYLGINPHLVSEEHLQQLMTKHLPGLKCDSSDATQALFSLVIEPLIGKEFPIIVYDFPSNQASLAKQYIDAQGQLVAARFEAYYKGIELANGFHELQDADEQLKRFEQDNIKRIQLVKEEKPIDWRLIEALKSGLPDCAGVALGIDRLLMLRMDASHIEQVQTFTFPQA